jgi:hypothetical protein
LDTLSSVFTADLLAKHDERDRIAVAAALARLQKALGGRTEWPIAGEPRSDATTRKEI